jgi:hypothetical protein
MKKLPIGISTFSEIITKNYCYVDKTPYVHALATTGKYYFLSRPRRFGKSLFVDTLKCAFEGRRELFDGLFLENNWDWNETRPVLDFSLGRGRVSSSEELNIRLRALVDEQAEIHGVVCRDELIADRFADLIRQVAKAADKRVVVLVDEYDKPILDNLEEISRAEQMRDGLKNFYSVLKDSDEHIEFCFITGVSKFSRVSIFSDLNNLQDISLAPSVGGICGYTQAELKDTFSDRLTDVDMGMLRHWYNGYNFLGPDKVYNPFDILLFFRNQQYGNYWFESATPSFLVTLLRREHFYLPSLEHIEVDEGMLAGFDLDRILPETVLFQAGYLTISRVEEFATGQRILTLDFPNQEVRVSLNKHLLNFLSGVPSRTSSLRLKMVKALKSRDMDTVQNLFKSLLSAIPGEWYMNNQLDRYEGYYASVVYAFLASLGFDLRPEESSSHGRCDLVVDTREVVYIIEFKVTELTGDGQSGLEQIRSRGYHDQYVQAGREVILVGMDFSKKERNLTGFAVESC